MKFLSIAAAFLAFISLIGFAINWSLSNIESLNRRWEEDWHQSLSGLTWIMNDAGAGLAILLLALGMTIQSLKTNKTPPTNP